MKTTILLALRKIFMKLVSGIATEKFLTWALIFLGEAGVRSTKTTKDDELFLQLVEILDAEKAKELATKFSLQSNLNKPREVPHFNQPYEG